MGRPRSAARLFNRCRQVEQNKLFLVKLNPETLSWVLYIIYIKSKQLRIVLFFVSCKEKDYYRVVSAGELSFNCCSYRERSHRIHGNTKVL